MSRNKIIDNKGNEFDSEEESFFNIYLEELKENGYVIDYEYQPESFILNETVKFDIIVHKKTKDVLQSKTLLQGREYTSDFKIYWSDKAKNIFFQNLNDIHNKRPLFIAQDNITYLDIKGKFNVNSSWAIFEANRKSVYEKYGVFVEKITPIGKTKCLFGKSFTPKELPMWQKRNPTKMYAWVKWNVKSLDEFVNEAKN